MTSMIAHPARGTESPSFKLENRVEVNPTTQETQAPPKPARANITLPSRFAALPNLCDNKAIVIGYTADKPSPITQALTRTHTTERAASSPATPNPAVVTPIRAIFKSEIRRKGRGPTRRPASRAP